jgi:hypothetical protein
MKAVAIEDRAMFDDLTAVRTRAIEHARHAVELSRQRRAIIDALLARGYAQADIARELGVTR